MTLDVALGGHRVDRASDTETTGVLSAFDPGDNVLAFRPAAPAIIAPEVVGGRIRPLETRDLTAVATLFLKTFRPRRRGDHPAAAIGEVADYMQQLYFGGPEGETGTLSLVHVDKDGVLGGFLGFIKSSFVLDGRVLQAGVSSALMTAEGAAYRRVGPQLMRVLSHSSLDLYITDSANRASFAFARAMKYEIAILNSLAWSRPFRPGSAFLDLVARRWPRAPTALLSPLGHAADLAARRMLQTRRRRIPTKRWRGACVDATEFARIAPTFLGAYRLRPAWTGGELEWLLAQASQQNARIPLHFRVVVGAAETPIGCFAFYGAPGCRATVLQILAADGHWDSVVDCMMHDTEAMGCIAVHGSGHAHIMTHLHAYPDLVFYYGGATMARSPHPEVIDAVRGGSALLGGLVGDRWTRLSSGAFGTARR